MPCVGTSTMGFALRGQPDNDVSTYLVLLVQALFAAVVAADPPEAEPTPEDRQRMMRAVVAVVLDPSLGVAVAVDSRPSSALP